MKTLADSEELVNPSSYCPICSCVSDGICGWCSKQQLKIKDRCYLCGRKIEKSLKTFVIRGNCCSACNAKSRHYGPID